MLMLCSSIRPVYGIPLAVTCDHGLTNATTVLLNRSQHGHVPQLQYTS